MAKRALDVANRLVAANKNIPGVMNIDWHLTVIDDGTVNAVAFPVKFFLFFLRNNLCRQNFFSSFLQLFYEILSKPQNNIYLRIIEMV